MTKRYALSVKQPWAALLVHGRKTDRGAALGHQAARPGAASTRPASRTRGRKPGRNVPPELREAARLVGGVVGAAELIGAGRLPHAADFVADQGRHLNEPSWFLPPRLYGFVFANPGPAVPGVPRQRPVLHHRGSAGEDGMTRLLVSVRSAAEAEAALTGGASVIDVKEPTRGALGRADDGAIADVVAAVAGRAPVSAALGELRDRPGENYRGRCRRWPL